MEEETFAKIVEEEWANVPSPYKERIENVAVLIENEPNEDIRKLEGLEGEETLLGLYLGVPKTERGEQYGVGMTLPDTITLYRLPILRETEDLLRGRGRGDYSETVREVIRETIWHEVGHYFGHDDPYIEGREAERTNEYGQK